MNFIIALVVLGFLSFICSAFLAEDMIQRINYNYEVIMELPFCMLALLDFYKDMLYVIKFTHFSAISVFFLWFSITAPFAMIYLFMN